MEARRVDATTYLRSRRRVKGLPNWRIVRYADDFVVLVHGDQAHVEALREDIADVLAPLGLRLSEAKTQIVHMSDGFDFLGFRIQWRRKRGTNKWYVYTFIADRPIRSLKDKIRALTSRLSQQPPRTVLIRLNQIMRGWSNYFRHAAAKHTQPPGPLRVAAGDSVVSELHRWRWKDVRRRFTTPHGRWNRSRRTGSSCSTSPRCRSPDTATGAPRSPTPGPAQPPPDGRTVESPVRGNAHAGFGERPGETDR